MKYLKGEKFDTCQCLQGFVSRQPYEHWRCATKELVGHAILFESRNFSVISGFN